MKDNHFLILLAAVALVVASLGRARKEDARKAAHASK